MFNRRDILLGASAALCLPKARAAAEAAVRFVQITDTHFGQRNHHQVTEQLARQINSLPMRIDFAVHTGDIMHDCILDEEPVAAGLRAMGGLNMPVHYVPGNHDILRTNHEPTRAAYEKHFGKLLDVHEYGGLAVVTAYTEPLAGSFDAPGFKPFEELEAALEALRGKPAVVCHHTPCVGNLYNNRDYSGWPAQTRGAWMALLNRHKVVGVLAGHFHRDEFHWLGNVPLHVCPPVSLSWGRQPAYRIYAFEHGRLNHRTQYLQEHDSGST